MGSIIVVPFMAFIDAARNLYEQGEITLQEYAGVLRRAKERQEAKGLGL